MKDVERELARRVDEFVKDLTVLVRRAALESVTAALAGTRPEAPRGRRSRAAGGKRTAKELDALSRRLVQHVTANAGQRVDEIARAVGATTKDVALPMRKLVQAGALTTKGQKRSTTYHPGSGTPPRSRKSRKADR